jgi:hypothetical protein
LLHDIGDPFENCREKKPKKEKHAQVRPTQLQPQL